MNTQDQTTKITVNMVKNTLASWTSGQGAPYGGDEAKQLQDTTIADVLKCSPTVIAAFTAVQVWKDHTLLDYLSIGYVGKAHQQKSESGNDVPDSKQWEQTADGYRQRAEKLALSRHLESLREQALETGKVGKQTLFDLLTDTEKETLQELEAREKKEKEKYNFVIDKGLRDIKPATKVFMDGRKKITVDCFVGVCEFTDYSDIVQAFKDSKEFDQLGTGEVILGTATLAVHFIEHKNI